MNSASPATLKFARRASRVVTKAERGTVASDKSMIQMYQDQIAQLQAELAKAELATLARLKAPAMRDTSSPGDNSDSEDEGELLEEERARLRIVQEEKAKVSRSRRRTCRLTALTINSLDVFDRLSKKYTSSSSNGPSCGARSRPCASPTLLS
jgi:hypothetical protein